MPKVTQITFENYKQFIGKRIEVEITCYAYGMVYPDNNVLIGMNDGNYYFVSDKDTADECYWHWPVNKDVIEKDDCCIVVWDYEEYKAFYDNAITKI